MLLYIDRLEKTIILHQYNNCCKYMYVYVYNVEMMNATDKYYSLSSHSEIREIYQKEYDRLRRLGLDLFNSDCSPMITLKLHG